MPTVIDPTTGKPLQAPAEPEPRPRAAQAGREESPDPVDQPPPPPEHEPVPVRSQPRRHTTPARDIGSLSGSLVNDVV